MSALGEIFRITPEDRQYNQRGLLSPVQRARWQRQRRWRLLDNVLVALETRDDAAET